MEPPEKASGPATSSRATKATSATPSAGTAKAAGTAKGAGRAGSTGTARPSTTRKRAAPRVDPGTTVASGDGPDVRRSRGPRGSRWLYDRRAQRRFEHWPVATRAVAGLLRHPDLVLALLGTRDPVEREGRVLNRNTQAMMGLAERFGGNDLAGETDRSDPVAMRRQLRTSAGLAMPTRTDVHAWGRLVPGTGGAPDIPVRVYRPFGSGLGSEDGKS